MKPRNPIVTVLLWTLAIIGMITVLPWIFSSLPSLIGLAAAFLIGFLVGRSGKRKNESPVHYRSYE